MRAVRASGDLLLEYAVEEIAHEYSGSANGELNPFVHCCLMMVRRVNSCRSQRSARISHGTTNTISDVNAEILMIHGGMSAAQSTLIRVITRRDTRVW